MDVDTVQPPGPLLERMDGAIGEASTVMGAMLTELLRRTLRGGVLQIGDELHGYVSEKVDATIAERTPAIEQAAADVAEHTARTAATEVATEEVHALEQRTQDSDRQLATRIDEATAETTRALTGRIEVTRKEVDEAARTTAADLAGRIQEAEKRAVETAQAEMARQMEELHERSREGTALMKARLKEITTTLTELEQKLADERQQRRAEQTEHRQQVAALAGQLEKERQARRAAEERLRQEFAADHDELRARLAEVEKPRGLRRLWMWLKRPFSRKAAIDH
jgi:chromosome segregation ATPase